MKEILEEARRLGASIAAHPRARALAAPSEASQADAGAQRLKAEYDQALAALRADAGSSPRGDERAREEALRRTIATHASIRRLLRAQADFQELMNGVSDAIHGAIGM